MAVLWRHWEGEAIKLLRRAPKGFALHSRYVLGELSILQLAEVIGRVQVTLYSKLSCAWHTEVQQ